MAISPTSSPVFTTIAVGADHAGFGLKETLKAHLQSRGLEVIDCGTHSTESVDYPDYAARVAGTIASGKAQAGLLVCGSGVGISIAANRYPAVRCALCQTPEVAALSRQHNDANALAMGARILDTDTAIACLNAFLDTAFEGGRHAGRVAKLGDISLQPLETQA